MQCVAGRHTGAVTVGTQVFVTLEWLRVFDSQLLNLHRLKLVQSHLVVFACPGTSTGTPFLSDPFFDPVIAMLLEISCSCLHLLNQSANAKGPPVCIC